MEGDALQPAKDYRKSLLQNLAVQVQIGNRNVRGCQIESSYQLQWDEVRLIIIKRLALRQKKMMGNNNGLILNKQIAYD